MASEIKVRRLEFSDHFVTIDDTLTPWLMEPGGSMLNSQEISTNPYPELNNSNSSY